MNGRYIVFADDDEDDLELITGYFKQFEKQINVLEFKDGREVLRFLEVAVSDSKPLPLLVILDINMPKMDGMTTLTAIRKQEKFNQVAVIIYTTTMSRTNMQVCKDLDASWIIKPNSILEIKETARTLADLCRSTSARKP